RDVTETFAHTGLDATRSLVEAGDRIVASINERSDQATTLLSDTKRRLEADVTEILNKIEDSNANLQGIVSAAGENLTEVEGNLARRAGEFRSAVDRAVTETNATTTLITEQVGNLRDVTSTTLADVQNLTGRFNDQSEELTRAARHLEDTNRTVESRVTERRSAIEEVADTLLAKTEAVDTLMRSFTQTLSETLETADDKARDAATMLSAAAEAASKQVSEQFESMRLTAGMEGQKARDAIRSAQDDIIAEMSRTVTDASDRFNDAATRMRDVARDVHRELEATRNELKQGVLNLPDEAEESSAALRKVVNEQIRALSELSDIVAKQSNSLDISRPQAQAATANVAPAPQPQPQPTPAASFAPAAPARQQAPAAEPRPAVNRPVETRRAQPQQADNGGSRGKGWVADLLRRASSDDDASSDTEPARTPLQTVESLNSLSVDIARAIDHETFIDLWNRYRNGERHVFTRRLYTLQGQQTFDEIRQKYARDPEFRTAVERYVADFEQLLAQVSRNDRDNMLGQTYLTSDTGKVYTMLAHASGRLD
ncbi:MAG: antitoxin, partial [Pseudomonadota bacterium]